MRQQNKSVAFAAIAGSFFGGLLFFCLLNPMFSFSEEIRYQSGDRRDPFIPVNRNNPVSTVVSGIKVEGIIYDKNGKSLVVIHGEMYKVGDTVDGQKIVAIYPNKIVAQAKGVNSDYWISGAEQQLAQKAGK